MTTFVHLLVVKIELGKSDQIGRIKKVQTAEVLEMAEGWPAGREKAGQRRAFRTDPTGKRKVAESAPGLRKSGQGQTGGRMAELGTAERRKAELGTTVWGMAELGRAVMKKAGVGTAVSGMAELGTLGQAGPGRTGRRKAGQIGRTDWV